MQHASAFAAFVACALPALLGIFVSPAVSSTPPLCRALLSELGPVVISAVVSAFVGASAAAAAALAASPRVFSRLALSTASSAASSALAVSFSVAAVFPRAALAAQWSPDLCVRPTGVGSSSGGSPFTILGEEGATVSTLRVYRNNGQVSYLRGLVVGFSDGLEVRAGVRKDQFSDLVFADGESITGMTLWKVSNSSSSSVRVGRIDIATNSRSWGFGVDNTARLSATAVDVGSGVLVGFQGRAGDDLDQLAPIFLKRMSSAYVDDIVFEDFGPEDGLRLVTLREGSAVWNGTDYSWTFSGSQEVELETSFSLGNSMSLNMGTTFRASVPFLESGIAVGWTGGTTQSYGGSDKRSDTLGWSTTISLSESVPAVSCSARVWEGRLNVRWTGVQTIVADGRVSSSRVSGTMRTVAYGKVETVCGPLSGSAPLYTKVGRRFVA